MDSVDMWLSSLFYNAPYIVSFIAGILSFLSPCILPLIPPYMFYISGVQLSSIKLQPHAKNDNNTSINRTNTQAQTQNLYNTNALNAIRLKMFLTSLLFIAGFTVVFVSLGIFANSFLSAIFSLSYTRYVAGTIVICFGLHFLVHFRFAFLQKSISLRLNHKYFGLLAPFVLGIGFAIGWSPCVGPILASILILATSSPLNALWLMLCYSAGLSLAFLLVALFVSQALFVIAKFKSFMRVIEVCSGLLLIGIGIAIMLGKTDFLV